MAWSRGKPVVGYKADSRTAFGGQDNPLVAGLFQFQLCDSIAKVVGAVEQAMHDACIGPDPSYVREEEISLYTALGSEISVALERSGTLQDVVDVILRFTKTATSSK